MSQKQGRRGRGAGAKGAIAPPPKFWAVEKLLEYFLVLGKFSSKHATFVLMTHFLSNFFFNFIRAKLKF